MAVDRQDPTGTAGVRRGLAAAYRQRWRLAERELGRVVGTDNTFGLGREAPRVLPSAAGPLEMFVTWWRTTLAQLFEGPWARPHLERAYAMGSGGAWGRSAGLVEAEHATQAQGIVEAVVQQAARAFAVGLARRSSPAQVAASLRSIVKKVGLFRSLLASHVAVVGAHASGTLDRLEQAGVRRVDVLPEHEPRRLLPLADAARRTPQVRQARTGRFRPAAPRPSGETLSRAFRAEARLGRLGLVHVLTAGDDRVCNICEDISEAGPYDIDEARGLIPAHPRCRCAFVPVED